MVIPVSISQWMSFKTAATSRPLSPLFDLIAAVTESWDVLQMRMVNVASTTGRKRLVAPGA